MENNENSNIPPKTKGAKNNLNLEEIVGNLNPEKVEKMFSELKVDDAISDAFYKSVESFFQMGFDLAKNLNIELIADFLEGLNKDQNK
jgi:hypothetical protein